MVDEKYNQGVENVREFVTMLYNEWDWSIGVEIKRLSGLEYEKAISMLIIFAKNYGYTFSLKDWENYVQNVIGNLPFKRDEKSSKIINRLNEPIENHSEDLIEYVYEICDFEGDPDWSKEEDYHERVEYVINRFKEWISKLPDSYMFCNNEEQFEGKGWILTGLGLSYRSGNYNKLIRWNYII